MTRHLERVAPAAEPQGESAVDPASESDTPDLTPPPTEALEELVRAGSRPGDSSLESLLGVAEGVVSDRRFQAGGIVDPGPPRRLSKEADRLLVGRLAELTGVFPVDRELLQRVRRMCLDLAADPADPSLPQ